MKHLFYSKTIVSSISLFLMGYTNPCPVNNSLERLNIWASSVKAQSTKSEKQIELRVASIERPIIIRQSVTKQSKLLYHPLGTMVYLSANDYAIIEKLFFNALYQNEATLATVSNNSKLVISTECNSCGPGANKQLLNEQRSCYFFHELETCALLYPGLSRPAVKKLGIIIDNIHFKSNTDN